jgi:hypothetical protein
MDARVYEARCVFSPVPLPIYKRVCSKESTVGVGKGEREKDGSDTAATKSVLITLR